MPWDQLPLVVQVVLVLCICGLIVSSLTAAGMALAYILGGPARIGRQALAAATVACVLLTLMVVQIHLL